MAIIEAFLVSVLCCFSCSSLYLYDFDCFGLRSVQPIGPVFTKPIRLTPIILFY